ncbi:MAG: molecular chaperone HtpG [Desulfosarcina sp.]|nr:molecular chaperone HtpG [Desulfobacterales bacterium]
MVATKETHQFKTEVQQMLKLIINSMYSNKEIFLRELISNSSDAIDKLSFEAQTSPDIIGDDTEFEIKITPDGINQTLEVSDNGIGMTYDEVMENIGTIAKSGTGAFLEALEAAQNNDTLAPELIGQFGIGFYSAFMAADKIILITRRAGSETATKWESHGDGSYTIEDTTKESRGTSIFLELKKQEKDEKDFTDEWTIRSIIKQHSDFVHYPIVMDVEKDEPIPKEKQVLDKDGKPVGETTKKVIREETLNSMQAIWTKAKDEISDKEHEEFYQHISHDWNPPLTRLHMKFEGATEYTALLYIPSKAPFDMFHTESGHGIHLYSRRVFIMDNCKELIPEYLRFVKGVVDAPDLDLNVSREILQENNLIRNIRRNLVKKIFELLKNMEKNDYEKFYEEFGQILKVGIHTDHENKNKISEFIRYKTTKSDGKPVSMKEYVENMDKEQKNIYYITGDNLSAIMDSPHLEQLKEKDIEVLLMSDPIDEWVVQSLTEYDGKQLKSAEKGDLDLEKIDEKKQDEYTDLFNFIKRELQDKIKEVKASTRLKDSVACLSGDTYDMSAYMEKIIKSSGQKTPDVKRVLELNIDHPVMSQVKALFEKDPSVPAMKEYCNLFLDIALISEGGKVENPARFSKTIGELMSKAITV